MIEIIKKIGQRFINCIIWLLIFPLIGFACFLTPLFAILAAIKYIIIGVSNEDEEDALMDLCLFPVLFLTELANTITDKLWKSKLI